MTGFRQEVVVTAALELLQWRADIPGSEKLLKPLSECLSFLTQLQGSPPESDSESDDSDDDGSDAAPKPKAGVGLQADAAAQW